MNATEDTRNAPEFQIGELVYYVVAYSHAQIRTTCPVCFGKLRVQIILGNGETETIECSACGIGYEGPRGFVDEFGPSSRVGSGIITGIRRGFGRSEWLYDVEGGSCEYLFRTAEEAEVKRAVLHAEALAQDEKRNDRIIADKKKGLAWAIRYHRSKIRDAEKEIAYHGGKLAAAEAKKASKVAV